MIMLRALIKCVSHVSLKQCLLCRPHTDDYDNLVFYVQFNIKFKSFEDDRRVIMKCFMEGSVVPL